MVKFATPADIAPEDAILTVIFNQRSVCLELVPKTQSNLPAASERSICLQQLSLSSRSSTEEMIRFLFLFNLQLNIILGQAQSLSIP